MDAKIKAVESSLNDEMFESFLQTAAKVGEPSEIDKQIRMAFCGFACMSCAWQNVKEDDDAGGPFNELQKQKKPVEADGDKTHPPGWWLGVMHNYLQSARSNLESRQPVDRDER